MIDVDAVVSGYIGCALWSSHDNADPETGGEPLDANYDTDDIAPETLEKLRFYCADFVKNNSEALETWKSIYFLNDDDQIGHDLWLTQNRHDAGFWEHFYGGKFPDAEKLAKAFTDAAHAYGDVYLYVGDDGKIHHD